MKMAIVLTGVLAGALFAAGQANAQFYSYPYTQPIYPGAYSSYYLPSGDWYPRIYATPQYYWSDRYFTTPYGTRWLYQQYNPYTNRYYYLYRDVPRYPLYWWRY